MKITLDLNKKEFEALLTLIDENPCEAGCIWSECEKSNCDNCAFTKAIYSLHEKVESIAKQRGLI